MPVGRSRHTYVEVLFTKVRGETVWKMAGGLSSVLLRLQEATDLGLLAPSWPPSEPRFCAYPDFPNSFGRGILRSSLAESCIERPPRAARSASKRLHAA